MTTWNASELLTYAPALNVTQRRQFLQVAEDAAEKGMPRMTALRLALRAVGVERRVRVRTRQPVSVGGER